MVSVFFFVFLIGKKGEKMGKDIYDSNKNMFLVSFSQKNWKNMRFAGITNTVLVFWGEEKPLESGK